MTNHEELSAMSGERPFENSPRLTLDEISIAGHRKTGGMFRITKKTLPKDRDTGFYETEETEKEQTLSVIFLKIRRQLVEKKKEVRKDGGDSFPTIRVTSEHTSKLDVVSVYDVLAKKFEYCTAEEAREKYPQLRTVQVVYVRYKGRIYRLLAKGTALGSQAWDKVSKEEKDKLGMSFYEYLSSFASDEHVYEYFTTLRPVFEEGANDYWTIRFSRGEKLNEEQMMVVAQNIRELHAFTEQHDAFVRGKAAQLAPAVAAAVVADDAFNAITEEDAPVEYPEAYDDTDAIPF